MPAAGSAGFPCTAHCDISPWVPLPAAPPACLPWAAPCWKLPCPVLQDHRQGGAAHSFQSPPAEPRAKLHPLSLKHKLGQRSRPTESTPKYHRGVGQDRWLAGLPVLFLAARSSEVSMAKTNSQQRASEAVLPSQTCMEGDREQVTLMLRSHHDSAAMPRSPCPVQMWASGSRQELPRVCSRSAAGSS